MSALETNYVQVDSSSLNTYKYEPWQECWAKEEDYKRDKYRLKVLGALLVLGVLVFFAIFNYIQVKTAKEDISALQRVIQGLTESLESTEATAKQQSKDIATLQASLIQQAAEIVMLESCSPCNH